jgi:hypothetical protein
MSPFVGPGVSHVVTDRVMSPLVGPGVSHVVTDLVMSPLVGPGVSPRGHRPGYVSISWSWCETTWSLTWLCVH